MANTSGPALCLDHGAAGELPVLGADFTLDYMTDPAKPSTTLRAGSLAWNVRSDDGGTAGAIGTITLNPIAPTDAFAVSITNGAAAGATSIESIALIDSDTTGDPWTGYSNLAGLITTTDVGEIRLVKDGSGNGGSITGDVAITGNLAGTLTTGLDIPGDLNADFVVSGQMQGLPNVIQGNVSGKIDIETLAGTSTLPGMLVIEGDVIGDPDIRIGTVADYSFFKILGSITDASVPNDDDLKFETISGTVILDGEVTGNELTIEVGNMIGLDGDEDNQAFLKLEGGHNDVAPPAGEAWFEGTIKHQNVRWNNRYRPAGRQRCVDSHRARVAR